MQPAPDDKPPECSALDDRLAESRALRHKLGYLSNPELAALLGVNIKTLQNNQARGSAGAPPFSKIGRERFTAIADAKAFIQRRRAK
jgi:hypothetical protein